MKDGYDDIQLVKRYSTAGLGPSQGRHANLNTIRIVARATGKSIESIGTTTFRPPLVPEKFAALAGRGFEPVRHTAMHHRHVEAGAQMMLAGLWMRPAYYGAKDDAARSIEREVRAVREGVGMIDVSTLGGLDVRGPDAAAFIERMYTWAYEKQQIGRARYALMTDQTGVVIDDGVAARLHERHYYVTATTGAVDQVYRQMTWFNAQWKMDVDVANVTAAYAGINLAGPQARAVIEKLASDIDFSAAAFPYMAARVGQLAGIPVRILRVGFVGELGYEIHCPSGIGEALWDRLMEAGKPFGIVPFGVEAQRILRLEKGHIIVGQDTDGLTHPAEANMEWALGKKKPFYVGKRAVDMQMAKGVTRKLAGFALIDAAAPSPKECHLVIRDGDIAGRVTSVTRSPTLGKVVGLAYLPPDLAEPGQALRDPRRRRPHGRGRDGGGAVLRSRKQAPRDVTRSCEHGRSRRLSAPLAAAPPPRRRRAPRGATWATPPLPKASAAPLQPAASASPTCRRCRASASRAAAPSPPCRRAASSLEATPNRAFRQPDGGLCLVLAPGEVILLSNLAGDGERLAQLESRLAHRGRGAHLSAAAPRQPRLAGGSRRAAPGDVRQAVRHRSAAGQVRRSRHRANVDRQDVGHPRSRRYRG